MVMEEAPFPVQQPTEGISLRDLDRFPALGIEKRHTLKSI